MKRLAACLLVAVLLSVPTVSADPPDPTNGALEFGLTDETQQSEHNVDGALTMLAEQSGQGGLVQIPVTDRVMWVADQTTDVDFVTGPQTAVVHLDIEPFDALTNPTLTVDVGRFNSSSGEFQAAGQSSKTITSAGETTIEVPLEEQEFLDQNLTRPALRMTSSEVLLQVNVNDFTALHYETELPPENYPRYDYCQGGVAFDGYYLTSQTPAEASGGDLQMNQRSLGQPPAFNGAADVTVSDGQSVLYLANEAAKWDSAHNADDWTLHATAVDTGDSGYTAELGVWDPGASTFTVASSSAALGQQVPPGFEAATLPLSSSVTFPQDDYLALRLSDVSDGNATLLDTTGDGAPDVSPTCLEEPTQDGDHYPTPEANTLALSGVGLVGLLGLARVRREE